MERAAPKPVDKIVIETPVKIARSASAATESERRLDRSDEQDPDARAAAHAVHEPDSERPEAGAGRVTMAVARLGGVAMNVAVLPAVVVVLVQVECSTPPTDEQPDGEVRDHEGDQGLGRLL